MGTSSQRENQGDTAAKRATERIQRLSGGVAEADPWGGNENNKEKSQRYGKFMGLYLFSIKEFAKKSFFLFLWR